MTFHLRGGTRHAKRLVLAAVLAMCTFFLAKGFVHLGTGPAEKLSEEALLLPATHSVVPSDPPPVELAGAILARNIFDSSTGPMHWRRPALPVLPVDQPVPSQSAALPPNRCADDVRLLGSVIVARKPERSIAMLRWQGKSHLLQVGDSLGSTRLLALRSSEAYLQPAGAPACRLPLFLPSSERVKTVAVPVREKSKPAKSRRAARSNPFTQAQLEDAVRSIGKDRFQVARTFMERALSNPLSFSGARFVPYARGGQPIGVRAHGVRADSLLYRLGVRNGDVLRSINGVPLTGLAGALDAFGQLRAQPLLTLALYRRGGPRTLAYSLE